MPEACDQSLARLTAGHGEQRRLGMFSRLVSPTLSHYLLQRCCNRRILQQRLAAPTRRLPAGLDDAPLRQLIALGLLAASDGSRSADPRVGGSQGRECGMPRIYTLRVCSYVVLKYVLKWGGWGVAHMEVGICCRVSGGVDLHSRASYSHLPFFAFFAFFFFFFAPYLPSSPYLPFSSSHPPFSSASPSSCPRRSKRPPRRPATLWARRGR